MVFQGAEGAYSQAAMMQYFGDSVDSFHVETFRDAMGAIEEGSADFAVLPIENSTAGIVNEIYDLLQEYENYKNRTLSAGGAGGCFGGYQNGVLPSAVSDAER